MIRTLSLATVLATAIALPALAEDAKLKIEPGTGPTSTMTDQVPQMKSGAEAIKADGSNVAKPLPASKATEEAVPSMRPSDGISGQVESKTSPGATAATTQAQKSVGMSLSEQDGKTWLDKPIYSSDGMNIGEVVSFQRDSENNVIGMHADIGGFWGFGQTRINLAPAQFKLQGDRVLLDLTAEQAKVLPKVQI